MASLRVLLDDTSSVSAFSAHEARLELIGAIDLALDDVARASTTSPVMQALKLLRGRANTKLEDSCPTAVEVAREAVSGKNLDLFQSSELLILQQALRTRRNSLALVFRLPTELLAMIMDLCSMFDDDEPRFRTRKFTRGLKIAHVCRRWRDVALGSAQFWASIVLSRPRWAVEMLNRSRNAPLTVGADMAAADKKTVSARDLVLAQLHRIRELHLSLPMFDRLPPALLNPAPILDTFYLWSFGRVNFVAPVSLFNGEAPSLRYLSLRSCQIHSESPLWDGLVSLELNQVSLMHNVHNFWTFLATRTPRLRSLIVTESILNLGGEPLGEPVRLALETLELTSSSWLCHHLLQNVVLPQCRIILNVSYSSADNRYAWRALESQRIWADNLAICGMELTDLPAPCDWLRTLEVSFFDKTFRERPFSPRYSVRLTADLTTLLQPNWRENSLSAAAAIISTDKLTSLIVNSDAFANCPHSIINHKTLRTLVVHNNHIEAFRQQLECDPLMAAGDSTRFDPIFAGVHYPALRKVHFVDIAFYESHMEVILDWLAQRKRLNIGIEEVKLVRCSLSGAELGSLKEVVTRVLIQRV